MGLRVLLVDDDPMILRSARRMLTRRGSQVLESRTFDAALEVAATHQVDAALVDVRLGTFDGVALARRLRAVQPALRVVLMTGGDPQSVGAPDDIEVLHKPFGLQRFFDVVGGVV